MLRAAGKAGRAGRLVVPIGGRVGVVAALVIGAAVAVGGVVPAAQATPPSLRSPEDVRELGEDFMDAVVAGDISAAYRALAAHRARSARSLVSEAAAAKLRHGPRRKEIGLSLGYEAVREERAGERVLRLSYFERYDRGGVVWRLIFFRPANVWLVAAVSETEDLAALFDPLPAADAAAPTAPAPTETAEGESEEE